MHMKKRFARRLYALVLPLALAVALEATGANAQTRIPRMEYKGRTLANGLKAYSLQDKSSPTVAIQVWYKVGSKDDPQDRSGFAHLFEHLLFKSTKLMPSEMMDRLTEDVGGANNAFTADDFTAYFEVVPSNHLERLLWAEADRLAALTVDDANFKSERDVVKEEFRQSVLAPPYGKLDYAIDADSWFKHPYRRPGIGSLENLDAATLEDVRAFHATFYRPDNATLVVVGDFDQAQLDTWVDKYFSPIPRPSSPIPRVTVKEPARTGEKRFTERSSNVPLPAVALTYLVPSRFHADNFALRVAGALLSAGESSRLFQSLVYTQRVAVRASASADMREDAGMFTLRATVANGRKPKEAENALLAEVRKLQTTPVSPAELAKAKNLATTAALRSRETNQGKAFAIGEAVTLGVPEQVNTDLAQLQAVTAADVKRVMIKYFTPANRVVIDYLQGPQPPAPASSEAGAR
jgi:zinc protease